MAEIIAPICWEKSKLTEDERRDFSEEERLWAYNWVSHGFIFDVAIKQSAETEWLAYLYNAIARRYDDGLRDTRASRAWRDK